MPNIHLTLTFYRQPYYLLQPRIFLFVVTEFSIKRKIHRQGYTLPKVGIRFLEETSCPGPHGPWTYSISQDLRIQKQIMKRKKKRRKIISICKDNSNMAETIRFTISGASQWSANILRRRQHWRQNYISQTFWIHSFKFQKHAWLSVRMLI